MRTLNIGTLQVDNPNLKNRTIDEIKAMLMQFLESDLVTNISPKKKSNWGKIDAELKSLKVVNKEGGDRLDKALTILGEEAKKSGNIEHKTARDEYLTNKYAS